MGNLSGIEEKAELERNKDNCDSNTQNDKNITFEIMSTIA